MCGGTLNFTEGSTVAECECCGTKQTLPKLSDEKRANLYDRANHFRRNNDYDKALSIYEQILNEVKTDAEAYWSIVLCKYGIEYVEDPSNHKRIPTVNRAQFTSIFADEDYKAAIANADGYQRDLYEAEAKEIDKIQKGILAISGKESPYDVFICYKETDNGGRRTQDSVLAQDLYFGLKNEGFNVFFSRITLEDKLGSAYEPHIFAAIHSAKVMVVLGTKAEHFNAVWVKNEWSRYLALIKKGENKTLIPAYKDMDPYDLPDEFSHLQAQDMSKLGFMQDLLRGIKKIVEADREKSGQVKETVVVSGKQDITPLLKRAFLFIEDGDFSSANDYAEKVLDINPECSEAYIVKALIDLQLCKIEQLSTSNTLISNNSNFKKAIRFSSGESHSSLLSYQEANEKRIRELNEIKRKETIYNNAIGRVKNSPDDIAYKKSISELESIIDYKDAREQVQRIRRLLEKWVIYKEDQKRKEEEMAFFLREQKRYDEQKKKKEKKTLIIFFSVLIAVIAVITVILIPVINRISDEKAAQEAAEQAADLQARNGLILKEKEDYYIVTGVEEFNEHIIIPSTYKGKEIKEVSSNAFSNTDIKSVEFPDTVLIIDQYAFNNCTLLTNITLPNGVLRIEYCAFKDCTSLKKVKIPDSAANNVNSMAFHNCPIEDITMPANALHFANNHQLKKAVITSGTTIIEDYFYDCSNLISVTLPESITSIGEGSFQYCNKLVEVINKSSNIIIEKGSSGNGYLGYNALEVFNSNDSYINRFENSSNGLLIHTKEDKKTLINYDGNLTEVNIPNGVTEIRKYAFYNCTSIINVTLPDSLVTIGEQAFYACTALTNITFSDGIKEIKELAFYNCVSLESIALPNSLTSLGKQVFSNCESLSSVVLSNSLDSISEYAFYECKSIKELMLPNGVTSIGNCAFWGCVSLTKISLSENLKTIGNRAFSDCQALSSIALPKGLLEIGEWVFSDCINLTEINIPITVMQIGEYAFMHCSDLKIKYEGASIPSIWDSHWNDYGGTIEFGN